MNKTVLMINVHEDDVLCFRKEVIKGLADRGYEVILLYPLGDRGNEIASDNIYLENIEMDRHGCNPFVDFKLLLNYYKTIKKYKPFVVLLYTIKPNIYGSIAAMLQHVQFVNNITGIGSTMSGNESVLQKFIVLLYKFALRKSKHVFFQNKDNQQLFLKKKICKENISSVIPGSGVDLLRFTYEEYPERSGKIVFNYIGRVMRKKGIVEYIKAAQQVKRSHPECEFNIIGFVEKDESTLLNLLEQAEKEGSIVYRGVQSDIKPWIIRSDAIILSSKYGEGISNVLLETAATGRALITTKIPGCECLVCNQNGFLASPGSVDELVRCIEDFVELDYEARKQMGVQSRELVEKEYSREIVVNEYIKLVDSISDD